MNQTLFSEEEFSKKQSNTFDLVWKSPGKTDQSKIQKDFISTLQKHQSILENAKNIEELLHEASHIFTNEIVPEYNKQGELEREKFIYMLNIYLSDKLNLKGRINESYRLMLLDICDKNLDDFENVKLYRDAIMKLENTSEKREREYEIKLAEQHVKNQYGIDIDIEEMANADFNDEETKERLKNKYKDFFEKQHEAEFNNQSNDDYNFEEMFGFKKRTRKKTAKQLEKEKQEKEVEDLINKDINKLFKEMAKVIHPDREQNPQLREKKENLMKQLSNARDKMNIAEILYIKVLIDNIIPENNVSTSFSDDSLKRFVKIIKQKIQELQTVNSQKLLNHPLFCDLGYTYVQRVIAKLNKSDLRKVVLKNIIATQNETKLMANELENIKQKPKLIKDIVKKYEQENFNDNDEFFDFLSSVKFK